MDSNVTRFDLDKEIDTMRNTVKDMIFQLNQLELKLETLKTRIKYPEVLSPDHRNYPTDIPWNNETPDYPKTLF